MNWQLLLTAIAAVESGGNPAVKDGDGGRAVGSYQIHAEVVADVNRVYGTRYVWPDDCRNPDTSREIAGYYLRHWCRVYRQKTHLEATELVAAGIWQGGPNGWRKDATLLYRVKVGKELAKQ